MKFIVELEAPDIADNDAGVVMVAIADRLNRCALGVDTGDGLLFPSLRVTCVKRQYVSDMQRVQVTNRSPHQVIATLAEENPNCLIATTCEIYQVHTHARFFFFSRPDHIRGLEPHFVVLNTSVCTREMFQAVMQQLGRRQEIKTWRLILCIG